MQAILHKLLPVFVLPIGLTLELVAAGMLFRRRWLVWSGVLLLWLCSAPFTSHLLVRSVERWVERMPASAAPSADAIVVLSTGRSIAPGAARISEWTDADRFYGGVELFKARKAPLLAFTGGSHAGQRDSKTEGEILIGYAGALGIPGISMMTTGPVTNTSEEAHAVAAALWSRSLSGRRDDRPHVLLVTSAIHMPRARALFEEAGVAVSPFPVDFKGSYGGRLGIIGFLPSGSALEDTNEAWREVYGHWYYRARSALRSLI